MNKEKFVKRHFEKLKEDEDVREYLASAKTEGERELIEGRLRQSLENSYDSTAKEYFDSKGIGSYVSTFLRYGGAAADAVGTYLFWTFGGAGFGAKALGAGAKTLADVIDAKHYAKHAKTQKGLEKIADTAKIAGEGVVERAAAYLPLGVGEVADLLRGRNKFDAKVEGRAVKYAKKDFLDYVRKAGIKEKQGKVIPLKYFQHPEYAEESEELAAAA